MADIFLKTRPGMGLSNTVYINRDSAGATITVEFARNSKFNSPLYVKTPVVTGRKVDFTLSSSEVDNLKDGYFRVKWVKDQVTRYLEFGVINYIEPVLANDEARLGEIASAAVQSAIAGPRIYGRTGGRTLTAKWDKAGAGDQALTSFPNATNNTITFGSAMESTGILLNNANKFTIPPGGAGKYRITLQASFGNGAAAGKRIVGIAVSSSTDPLATGSGWSATGASGEAVVQAVADNVWLKDGDVVSFSYYVETTSVIIKGTYFGSTMASIVRIGALPIKSQFIGNSGPALDGLAPRKVLGDWSWRSTWAEVANMDALFYPGNTTSSWLPQNPDGLYNIGTALIPDARPLNEWPALLDEVIAGTRDSVFTEQGKNLAKYGTSNMVIRPMWEANMWNSTLLDPAKYIAAFNRAVPLIRAGFAAQAPQKRLRVAYSFLDAGGSSHRDYYPGDANVDIIDMDLYSRVWRSTQPTKAELLEATRLRLIELSRFAAQRGKPLALGEWGLSSLPAGGGTTDWGLGDVPEWIDLVFDWIEQNNPEYAIYFNITDGAGMALDTTPLSKARYIERAKLLA